MTDDRFNPADDNSFADLVGEVTPLPTANRADLERRPGRRSGDLDYRRAAATREEEALRDNLTSELAALVESEEELLFAAPGVQLRIIKRLKQGHIPWEEGLDLHGHTVDHARDELSRFMRDAVRKELRCVIVVHGKALREDGSPPLLKSYVNDWLRQIPSVVAFCSAQPRDGGRGALYVLLKRKR